MLRSFRLINHRSFLDEQELVLIPSAPGHDHEVLTLAAIYGANASGKSNLIDGLRFMSDAVHGSFRTWRPEGGVPRKPFRLSSAARVEPSTFVVEIVVNDVLYTYGFSVDDHVVVAEWLYAYPEKRKRILFERDRSDMRFGTTVGQLRPRLEVLAEIMRGNSLFLSVAAQSNLDPLAPVLRWFTTNLKFRTSSRPWVEAQQAAEYVEDNEPAQRRFLELLAAADTGITNLHVVKRMGFLSGEAALMAFARERVPTLVFEHGVGGELFEVEDESAGTRNWVCLLPYVLAALERGSTLVIDEIDASLHPLLTVRLLHLFGSAETNPRHAQLIFTTHDTTPLGSYVGPDVLHRDQVWFVEKNTEGRSRLYPLSDFKPRSGENTEKRYLAGSYGAVPVLNDTDFGELPRAT